MGRAPEHRNGSRRRQRHDRNRKLRSGLPGKTSGTNWTTARLLCESLPCMLAPGGRAYSDWRTSRPQPPGPPVEHRVAASEAASNRRPDGQCPRRPDRAVQLSDRRRLAQRDSLESPLTAAEQLRRESSVLHAVGRTVTVFAGPMFCAAIIAPRCSDPNRAHWKAHPDPRLHGFERLLIGNRTVARSRIIGLPENRGGAFHDSGDVAAEAAAFLLPCSAQVHRTRRRWSPHTRPPAAHPLIRPTSVCRFQTPLTTASTRWPCIVYISRAVPNPARRRILRVRELPRQGRRRPSAAERFRFRDAPTHSSLSGDENGSPAIKPGSSEPVRCCAASGMTAINLEAELRADQRHNDTWWTRWTLQ